MMCKLSTFLLLFSVFNAIQADENELIVQIKQGTLKGKYWTTQKGRIFSGFTGIPYAKPPINELRFEPPVPLEGWQGILNATSTSHNVCTQPDYQNVFVGSEDCLYLNVYRPSLNSSKSRSLPVMFYIHGGSFLIGSASPDWLGPEILLDKDIILVTLNYRLGSFGFLSTADEIVPGNNGLKDVRLALKWTKENIAYFNGDPDKITVFGSSAGSMAAHLLTLSHSTRNLMSKVIMQSGTALLLPFSTTTKEDIKQSAYTLGSHLNCSRSSMNQLVDCLKSVEFDEIVQAEIKMIWDPTLTIVPFYPVVEEVYTEGVFLSKQPLDIIKSGEAANVPMIAGVVPQEGGYKTADLISNPGSLTILDVLFNLIIPEEFQITTNKINVSKRIRKFYFGDNRVDVSTRNELTKMYTDGWFIYGVDKTIRVHSKYSNQIIYEYLFDYRGSASVCDLYGTNYNYGVCHTDELLYLFTRNRQLPMYNPSEEDKKMMGLMTTLWTNFASNGCPNTQESTQKSSIWYPVKSKDVEYFHIKDHTNLSMSSRLFLDRMLFWKTVLH